MEPTQEVLAEIIKVIEGLEVKPEDANKDRNYLSTNEAGVPLEENAYVEIDDTWGLEFYDCIVEKGDFVYFLDAYNDGDIFGARVLKDSDTYREDYQPNLKHYTYVKLD